MTIEETEIALPAVSQGFEKRCLLVRLDQLLPRKSLPKGVKHSKKYRQIATSIVEIGLVEPPVIARDPGNSSLFFILDGHLRIEVLRDLNQTEVECLISTDDEAFTYNKQVSRLAAVQEHAMIVKALEQGVPEERLASIFAVNIETIRRRKRMLNGVCIEASELLKDKNCPMAVFEVLRKMQAVRQIEAAELMINANNYSTAYIGAILAGTPQAQLADPTKPKQLRGMTVEAIARMEKELARLQQGMSSIQESYGKDHLELTVIKGYIKRLLGNARVVSYLLATRPEYVPELQSVVDMTSSSTDI
ncbi:ParB-like nuclease domain-containing protein [Phyllobacterium sp. CL33Tsu]|uniref:plasmid partitioning protein RepB C-terminal domain-containing protein n=1 Tax=Phyllobacterium sp. CL33Tsu TaxID=1798191 RepID=UPI0008E8A9FF|nr:plasmid partitioning protein RepB C-terminal domain-containing protein [Phyllobacterium sp. CL33Tsu]SFI64429.1 ParB-like nuclease domain-containing protein [Phyllobacterium sp. CL33Tsu]